MKPKQIIISVILLIAAAAGFWAYLSYQKKTPDIVNKKPDFIISAGDLLNAFTKDTAAGKMYIGKIVEMNGIVKTADTSAIVLGEPGSQSSIVCGVDRRHTDDYKKIKIGSSAIIQGTCVAYEKGEEILGVSMGTTIYFNYAGVKTNHKFSN